MNILGRLKASALRRLLSRRHAAGPRDRGVRAPRGAWAPDMVLGAPGTRPGAFARLKAWLHGLDRRARVIGLMIVLCLASIWTGLGLVMHAAHRQLWDDASAYTDNVAKLLVGDLERNFALCDLSLQALLANLSNPALLSLPPTLRHQAMFNSSFDLPIFGSLLVTDKDGVISEHANTPLTRRVDVSDRDYFKVQRDQRDVGVFLDHPFVSRINNEWVVVASRRIDKGGRFDGVVAGGLRLDFLKGLFLKVHLPPGSTLVLRYEDGTVMMSNAPGATAWDPAFVKRIAASEDAHVVRRSSDGIQRLVKERKVSGLPLYQSVSLPVAAIMKPFWHRFLIATIALGFTTVVISTLGISLMRELSRRNVAEAQLQRLATIDGLTGLRNRRCFDDTLEAEIRRGARGGRPLALLMIDVDYFKAYNDNYGHAAGDAALRAVADVLSGEPLRSSDVVARVGGEEFAVLAPDTDLAGAARLAERILCAVRERRVSHIGSRMAIVTVSIGLACVWDNTVTGMVMTEPGGTDAAGDPAGSGASAWAKSLFDEADAALYRAKRGGRDRAEVSQALIGACLPREGDRLIA